MGNCVGICNTNVSKGKGDVIIERGSENETGKYLDTQYIKKVIYIQKSVKKYLKKIKSERNPDNKDEKTNNSSSIKKNKPSKQSK